MKKLLLVLVVLFFAGCSVKEVEVRPKSYRLENILHVKAQTQSDGRVLKVQKIEGDSAVMTRSILYKKEGALLPYKYSRWSEIPSTRLQQMIVEYFEAKKIFKATIPSLSMANSDLILESELRNFEQVFSDEGSYVIVKLSFRLIQRDDGSVLGSTSLTEKIDIKSDTTQEVVKAFESATNRLVVALSTWVESVK